MHSRAKLAFKWLYYYFTASNGRGYGIHSPFVYEFVKKVLNDARPYEAYPRVENLRKQLLKDTTLLEIRDLGAGSALGASKIRSVRDLARHAAKPRRLGQLLFRIARYYQPGTMLELGTSLGLSSMYLAIAAPEARLLTIEGADSVAAVAAANFRSMGMANVELITGDFGGSLPAALARLKTVDLAFIDGNHRLEPTLRYFNLLLERATPSSVLIFDDIHWSGEMEAAWKTIRQDPRAKLTIDLFFIGLVFLQDEFKVKQDFVIRY